jgi:hypothetical protein
MAYARVLALGAGDRCGFSRNEPYANRPPADAVLGCAAVAFALNLHSVRDIPAQRSITGRQHNTRPLCRGLRRPVLARQCRQLARHNFVEFDRNSSTHPPFAASLERRPER